MTVKAIYQNGVIKPVEPVQIAEGTAVEVIVPRSYAQERQNQREILSLLRKSYSSGHTDTAECHNDHQP